jgi:hypothetical protein
LGDAIVSDSKEIKKYYKKNMGRKQFISLMVPIFMKVKNLKFLKNMESKRENIF